MPAVGVTMSSFRADVDFAEHVFVPAPLIGLHSAKGDVGGNSSDFAAEASFGVSRATDGDGAMSPATPEQIELLEEAAFQRGVESARESADALARVCGTLEDAARELERVASTSIMTNRDLLLNLAMEIAKRWVAEELKLDPALFAAGLERALAEFESNQGATLVLNPNDRATLLETESERVTGWQGQFQVDIAEDAELELGAFRIEGAGQTLDATAEAIGERLSDALAEALAADLPEVAS